MPTDDIRIVQGTQLLYRLPKGDHHFGPFLILDT